MEEDKGKTIRFVKGVYAGCTGWLNKSRKKKKGSPFRSVIVHVEDDEDDLGFDKYTRVKDNSYRPSHKAPASFEEAALQQHPDLELTMIRFAEMLAECGITDPGQIGHLFAIEFARAVKYQHSLKSKARYRSTIY